MLCSKESCTGCAACYNICPKHAIRMETDQEGFVRPFIDDKVCVECRKCETVCHVLQEKSFQTNRQKVYAVKVKDDEVRERSSSGGLFSALAEAVLAKQGIVYGAAYDEELRVVHIGIEDRKELYRLQGSKYVQSNLGNIYRDVQEQLDSGRTVLFGGTPCQVAGLYSFLGENRDNLYTYDIVCHGVPSPKIFSEYLKYIEEKRGQKATRVDFRYKRPNWSLWSLKIDFENGEPYIKSIKADPYMLGFLNNYFLRESCHNCRYTSTKRVADVTIADFWGIEQADLAMENDNRGISLCIVNSEKGQALLDASSPMFEMEETTMEKAAREQPCLKQSFSPSPEREAFWVEYEKNGFSAAMNKFLVTEENRDLLAEEKDAAALRTVIIPSDGVGSKGDEAMLRGALNFLEGMEDIEVWNPREECWKEWLVDRNQDFKERIVPLEKLADAITEPCHLFVIGADIMDGLFGVENTMARLNAIRKNINLGGSAEVFSCSFREDAQQDIIEKIINLGDRVRFYIRDRQSLEAFQTQTGRQGVYFPDLAFQCESAESDRTREVLGTLSRMKADGRITVGINLCEHSFRGFYKQATDKNRKLYVQTMIDSVLQKLPNAVLVLIPHDIREWEDNLSDDRYIQMAYHYLKAQGNAECAICVEGYCTEAELLTILSEVDIVISGRMHLTIAGIRRGSVPVAFFGESGSLRNTSKFRGLFAQTVGRDDLVACNKEALDEILGMLSSDLQSVRKQTRDYFHQFEEEAERIIGEEKAYRQLSEPSERSGKQLEASILDIPRMFADKNKKIRELRNSEACLRNQLVSEHGRFEQEKAELKASAERDIAQIRSDTTREIDGLNQEIFGLNREISSLKQEVLNKVGHIELLLPAERELIAIKNSIMFRIMRLGCRVLDVILFVPKIVAKKLIAAWKIIKRVNIPKLEIAFGYCREEGLRGAWQHLMRDYHQGELKQIQIDLNEKIYEELTSLEECRRIVLPVFEEPVVSIVIPAYNQFTYTYYCIESIVQNSGDVAYEVILADDCSNDLTEHIQDVVDHLVVSRTEKNLLFLRNCNQAARKARGKYILFLNNDTQVQKDWLKPLVDLLEKDPTIGMTGSKLVYSDGTLQEAGGIIWRDGSGWNYGRNDDAMKPEYNYVREVDYISGASIMIRRELWEQLGGFDELFAPAYCEDADLAFQVRKAGYKVVYQPLSVVVHFEGKSNGTDLNSGVKQYQIENSRKLRQKWRTELFGQYAQGQDVFKARERTGGKKVVLMVDHYVPQFDKDAGSKTIYQYLKMFVENGYVVKFIGDNFFQHEPYTTILQQMGIEVLYGPWYAQHWQEWISDNQKYIDFAFLNRPHIAVKYIDFLKEKTGIKCIYYGHDLHFLRLKREYELTGDAEKLKESEAWKEKELYLMRNADISYYPSCVEVEEIRQLDPEIPAKAITAYAYKTFPEDIPKDFAKREGLLFVGGFGHPPNIDAVLWFAKEIYPKIREKREIPFYIVGSKPTAEVLRLDGGGITVKGFVSEEELQELYRTCRLVTIPLRYGAGVKGKVVEALYYGTPMVTTSVGAEGIEGIEQVVNIADDAETFAAAVTELYDDVEELARRSELCRNFAKTKFSMDAVWAAIEEDFR